MCSIIAVLLFAIYLYEYVANACLYFIYQSRYIRGLKANAVLTGSSRYINEPRATSIKLCSGCVKTTSYFRRSVSPAMQRYLFEKRRDGHFVVIPDCDSRSQSQYGLAFIGTWNLMGSSANSRSLSLSWGLLAFPSFGNAIGFVTERTVRGEGGQIVPTIIAANAYSSQGCFRVSV